MDAVKRVGGDAAAIAQPCGELAVIDGAPSEGRLGKPRRPAIVRDFLQQLMGVHGTRFLKLSSTRADPSVFLVRTVCGL